jgi:predicted enzyme related to lactoylglutathione lyase
MDNHVVWFDIPAIDLDRACRFYAHVLGIEIKRASPDMPVGVFKHDNSGVSGCVFQDKDTRPSADGPLLYMNVSGRLDDAIANVDHCGGKVLKAKHQIGPYGWRAIVLDSEGNRIALHSEN